MSAAARSASARGGFLSRLTRGAAACLALAACGCQTMPLRPLPKGDPRPAARLARWTAEVAGRQALRGSARLAVDAPHGAADGGALHVRSRQRVVLARPARMRVEVQGLLGTTLAVLTVDDTRYAWFEAGSRHFESGPVRDGLLWDLVRLDLTPAEAVDVILGARELSGGLPVTGAWDAGDGVVRIAFGRADGSARRSLDLDDHARLRRLAVVGDGVSPGWEARFDDYATVSGTPLAHRITVETDSGTRAVLSLADVELNPPLTPDIFTLQGLAPEGVVPEGEGG